MTDQKYKQYESIKMKSRKQKEMEGSWYSELLQTHLWTEYLETEAVGYIEQKIFPWYSLKKKIK